MARLSRGAARATARSPGTATGPPRPSSSRAGTSRGCSVPPYIRRRPLRRRRLPLHANDKASILASLAPLELSERAAERVFLEVSEIRGRLRRDRARPSPRSRPKAETLAELERARQAARELQRIAKTLAEVDEETLGRLRNPRHGRRWARWGDRSDDHRIELRRLGAWLERAAVRAALRREKEATAGRPRMSAELNAVRALGDLFERVTEGRKPSRYDGTARKPGAPTGGPYFPPFLRAALGREASEDRSLAALVEEARKVESVEVGGRPKPVYRKSPSGRVELASIS